MSTHTITRKRKSADGSIAAVKKVKTAKSADRPAPLKSALKKAKKSSTKAVPSENAIGETEEVTVVDDDAAHGDHTDLTPDQTAALLAGFSSDDEDGASDGEDGIAVASLPKAPTTGDVQKRINQVIDSQKNANPSQEDPERTPGVVYIGRIPHGFYEHQLRAYFSQFGDITNLRLMRNRKTGKSQHYGFIEFSSTAVADIVCKTMDKYLLFGHILQVRRVPLEQVNEKIWRKSSRRARNVAPRNRLEGTRLRKGATRDVWEARVEREEKKRNEKAEKLRELGYEFEMPALKSVDEVAVKPKMLEMPAVEGASDAVDAEANVLTDVTGAVEEKPSKKRSASGKNEARQAVKKAKV